MKTKTLFLGLIILLSLVILVSAIMVFDYFRQADRVQEDFSELEQLIVRPTRPVPVRLTEGEMIPTESVAEPTEATEPPEETEPTENLEAQQAYEAYGQVYELNPDFVGWVQIEDTKLNYPVMQTVSDPDYYLDRDFEKNYSAYGVPFMEALCKPGTSNNLIIYGHNMKNGSMFHTLVNYSSQSYYREHSTIWFDTLEDFGEYEIIAAFSMDVKRDLFRYNQYINMSQERFEQYVAEIKDRSFYDTGVSAKFGDQLLTLSTCEYTHNNGRFVVVAKKVQ